MTTSTCRSCGAGATGSYCAACGQRQPRPGDFSLRHLAGEAWEEISNTDSRLWRSVAGIFRPGVLTRAWLDYRWQAFFPPLRLYLLLSGVYFLLAWDVGFALNVEQVRALPAGSIPAPVLAIYQDEAAIGLVGDLTALLKFVSVVVMGLWVALLHRGNRSPIGAHMVFALHYTTFDFAVFSLQAPLVAYAPPAARMATMNATLLAGLLLLFVWATVAVRRVYGRGWPSSVLRGVAVLAMDVVLSSLAGQIAIALVVLSRL